MGVKRKRKKNITSGKTGIKREDSSGEVEKECKKGSDLRPRKKINVHTEAWGRERERQRKKDKVMKRNSVEARNIFLLLSMSHKEKCWVCFKNKIHLQLNMVGFFSPTK